MSQDFRGDFLGFTYNGIHSSNLGIVRVTAGDRDEKSLLPNIKDNTVDIPGSDGLYFFDAKYQQLPLNLNLAFDNVTEEKIREIQQVFGDNLEHDVIFDELPFKIYRMKITSPPKINFICFDDNEIPAKRIYKGEGSFSLTAFMPFARSRFKTLPEYYVTEEDGLHYDENGVCVEEWSTMSGLPNSLTGYDTFVNNSARVMTPGDLDSHFTMLLFVYEKGVFRINQTLDGDIVGSMIIDTDRLAIGSYYRINTLTKLLEGGTVSGGVFTPNGYVYNRSIVAGDFFTILNQPGDQRIVLNTTTIVQASDLKYDYRYF